MASYRQKKGHKLNTKQNKTKKKNPKNNAIKLTSMRLFDWENNNYNKNYNYYNFFINITQESSKKFLSIEYSLL